MAYARLRDEAIERAIDGTPQEVWHNGEWIGMKRVRNDRLLIAMLAHLKHEPPPHAMMTHSLDDIEDRRSNVIGNQLESIAAPVEDTETTL
jgi:hypothetical protein